MTDYSKLTDKQINELMQSFPNSMVILDKKGKRKLIDYVNDDGFWLRIVKENKLSIKCFNNGTADYWEILELGQDIGLMNENLNRAICERYLKIKGIKQ